MLHGQNTMTKLFAEWNYLSTPCSKEAFCLILYLNFHSVYLISYYYLYVKFVMWIVKQKLENKRNLLKKPFIQFGIQARGGCACAGPYAQRLLGMSPKVAKSFADLLKGPIVKNIWTDGAII